MAFQVSPGVEVKEIDLTNVVPAVSTSIGAFVGNFAWGPVEEPTTITSEKDLAETFGVPSASASVDFFTASYFLKYGNNLKVVRKIDSTASNATTDDSSTIITVHNADDYQNVQFELSDTLTVNGEVLAGNTDIIVDSLSNVTVGDAISGTGIAAGATIDSIDNDTNTITLSTATTGTVADDATLTVAVNRGNWIAKYPGALGNSLQVVVCPASTADAAFNHTDFASYKGRFSAAPGTSDYADNQGGSGDEMHIVVVDEDGAWTGTAGTILETFAFVSQASDAKTNDGASNYYKDVINNQSQYIWWGSHNDTLTQGGSAATTTFSSIAAPFAQSLVGGNDSGTLGSSEVQTGFDLFEDAETIDVSFLIAPKLSETLTDATAVANDIISIAAARKDCVAFISPPVGRSTNTLTPKADIIEFADTLTSTSYAVIDSSALKVYDKYNDQYIWIPASSSIAGLCAGTDDAADPWFSPAGFSRGQLLGVTKVGFNPKKAERDELYLARVNPITTFPGEGTVLFGDKTAQAKPSAFDRINVRRLFIVLEKAVATAAKYQLFEFNDEFTRAMFRNMVEPFLRDVQGRRGITDFRVVCDETNNTGQVVDANQFVADIYIKPARSINFITLNFIATRTGVEFSEITGG